MTHMFRITIDGRYFSPKNDTLSSVVARAYRLAKIDETVSIEDSEGRQLAEFTKRGASQ